MSTNTASSATSLNPSPQELFPGVRTASSSSAATNAGNPEKLQTAGSNDADLAFFDAEISQDFGASEEKPRSGQPQGRKAQGGAPENLQSPAPSAASSGVPAPTGSSEETNLPLLDLEGNSFSEDPIEPSGQQRQQHPAGPRNVEGLPPEIVEISGNMSNKAWAVVEPILREHQTLKNERYADHPEGYTLAPEYQNFVTQFQQITTEQQFAQQQLAQAKAGEAFFILTHDDNGNPVKQGPFDPTTESIAELEQLILDARGNANDIRKAAVSFKENFSKTHKAVDQRINAILEPIFKPYEKVLDKQIDAHFDKLKLPAYVRQRPDLRNTAKLLLLFQHAMKEVDRLSKVSRANGTSPIQQSARRTPVNPNSKAITPEDEEFFNQHM